MTDKQIVEFILHRAQLNGQKLHLTNPKLVVYGAGQATYLGVLFDGLADPCLVRFGQGGQYGLFKIVSSSPEFSFWRASIAAGKRTFAVDFDLDNAPSCVKHNVSYAVIEALKTEGIGFDLWSPWLKDIELIDPSESYEEVAIEADLLSLGMPELTGQVCL